MALYCSNCGKPLPPDARNCPACGHEVPVQARSQWRPPIAPQGRLVRPRFGRKIAGVCQGIANAYGWDVTVIRILFVILALTTGIGAIAYVVMWVVTPEEPYALPPVTTGYTPPQA